jgi:phospholipid-binding lipoprotein MlaA
MIKFLPAFFVFCALLICGCTATPSNPRDPLEPLNRGIYKFNDKADRWVMKPVAQSYHDYMPSLVRTGVSNFFNNLNDANSIVNYALQGQVEPSLYNLARFLLNSTVGVAGLFDVSSGQERIYQQTSFGDTFAVWGWKNSSYFVIPLAGPSTLRDGTGLLADITFRDNTLYSNPTENIRRISTVINAVSTRDKLLGVESIISDAALDPYSYTRDAWLQVRAKRAGDDVPKSEEDFDIDDLMN